MFQYNKKKKKRRNAEIMISNDVHLHTQNCPREANLLDWDDYEIKKYSYQIQNLTNTAHTWHSSQNAQRNDFYFRIQDLFGKEHRKVIPPVENISQYHDSQVLEMSRLPARSKSQYFANEEKLISRKERGGFSRERVVE